MRPKYKVIGDKIEYEYEKKSCIALINPEYPTSPHMRIWKEVSEATDDELDKAVEMDSSRECPIMENVCNFYKKDDEIKSWCKKPEIMSAFIHIIFNQYGKKAPMSENMKEEINDFQEEEKEEDRFLDLFNFLGDKEWDTSGRDWVAIAHINVLLKKAKINLSPQKYKNYLLSRGAVKGKKINENTNKRENAWINIQVDDNKVKLMTEGYGMESDEED